MPGTSFAASPSTSRSLNSDSVDISCRASLNETCGFPRNAVVLCQNPIELIARGSREVESGAEAGFAGRWRKA